MRNTDMNPILFDVDVQPIHFLDAKKQPVLIPSRKVVADLTNRRSLGVVGENYRLVSNHEAVEFAHDCALQLFGLRCRENLEVFNVIHPRRPWYCRVDFVHKGYEVNVLKKEVYLPFVRMTNSYNGTRALRFDIGYCRKLCLNGVIFEQETIQFRFSHSRRAIGARLNFEIAKDQLEGVRERFTSTAERLHGFAIPEGLEIPLFFRALGLPMLPKEQDIDESARERFEAIQQDAKARLDRYFGEMGRNAYAVFNAVTDFASHPPSIRGIPRDPHWMQRRAGDWSREFAELLASRATPDLARYLTPPSPADPSRN